MPESTVDTRKLFAEFGIRMAGIGFDLFLLLYLFYNVLQSLLPAVEGTLLDNWVAGVILFSAYFAAFWISPLKATPVQFLFGMRVVDEHGEKLSPLRAVLRAITLAGLIFAALMFFRSPGHPLQLPGIISFLLLLPAIVTANRQAAHDFLAGSIVVNRVALNSAARKGALLKHVADNDPATRRQRRPTVSRMVVDTLVLVFAVVVIWNGVLIAHDRDMHARIAYAIDDVSDLKTGVTVHYELHGEWPPADADLGMPRTGRYPDGGYYELEADGVIRIRFQVKRELRSGSIVLRPATRADELYWDCAVDGYIDQRYLPAACR